MIKEIQLTVDQCIWLGKIMERIKEQGYNVNLIYLHEEKLCIQLDPVVLGED